MISWVICVHYFQTNPCETRQATYLFCSMASDHSLSCSGILVLVVTPSKNMVITDGPSIPNQMLGHEMKLQKHTLSIFTILYHIFIHIHNTFEIFFRIHIYHHISISISMSKNSPNRNPFPVAPGRVFAGALCELVARRCTTSVLLDSSWTTMDRSQDLVEIWGSLRSWPWRWQWIIPPKKLAYPYKV